MGDTLRRAAAKCLLGVDPDALAEYFDSFQFAVSIHNGTEVVIHAGKWRREAMPGEGVVQIDFNNAFNIYRSAILQAIRLLPGFSPLSEVLLRHALPIVHR